MHFNPTLVQFLSLNSGSGVGLHDGIGCTVRSANALRIQAGGDIAFHGRNVSLTAPTEVSAAGGSSVINLCNDVDTNGGSASFVSTKPAIGNVRFTPIGHDQLNIADMKEDILAAIPIEIGNFVAVEIVVDSAI